MRDEWNSQTIAPSHREPKGKVADYPCFALLRLFGSVGFTSFAIAGLYGARAALHLAPITSTHPTVSPDNWKSFGVAIVAGFIGWISSIGVAVRINVRNDETNRLIATVWHFTANGAISYVLLLGAEMSIVLGKGQAQAATLGYGPERMAIRLFAEAVVFGLVSGLYFYFAFRYKLSAIGYSLTIVTVAWGAAYLDNAALGIHSSGSFVVGLLVALTATFMSPAMVQKDLEQRKLWLEEFPGRTRRR